MRSKRPGFQKDLRDRTKVLLLHYRNRIVAIKGYDLPCLEVENINAWDIYEPGPWGLTF